MLKRNLSMINCVSCGKRGDKFKLVSFRETAHNDYRGT